LVKEKLKSLDTVRVTATSNCLWRTSFSMQPNISYEWRWQYAYKTPMAFTKSG